MKKQTFLAAAIGAMMVALPLSALAGVVGSPHDLPLRYTYTGSAAKQGTCSFCHVPHKAQSGGEKLFPVTADTNANNAWGSNDSISLICWYCHGAGTTYGSAEQVNPFNSNAHKRSVATLTGWGDVSWPSDVKVAGDNNLRCVSCHSIHDNARRPFLAWGTATGDLSATSTGFCGKCHANRSNASTIGTANPGNHPSFTAMTDNGSNSPLTGASLPGIMQANMASLSTTSAIGAPWNLGGHAYYSGGAEQAGNFNCGSCHAVHMNESANWASDADGSTTVASAVSPAGDPILVASNATATAAGNNEAVCAACHSIAATRGPGASGSASHPFNTESLTASQMLTATRGYKWGLATNSIIQCQSCHDIHWSTNGHSNNTIAAALGGDYLLAYACNDCHSASTTAYANHHPSGVTVTEGTTVKNNATTSTATDWVAKTQTTTTVEYFAATNVMSCDTCHGLGNAHAHNNSGGFPGLTGIDTESDMCVDCHTFNPSTYTDNWTSDAAHTATHYVGTIKTASYKKTNTFIATGGADNVAKYSADGGTDGSIICESCHTLKINGKNGHEITYAASNNASDGQTATSDSVRLLLEVSGNSRTVAAAADSMCTECHGASPGAGVTHPVEPTYTADATTKISFSADQGVTLTGGTTGKIVCESCHRPHDADTDSSSWILEAAAAGTGYTDYSSLCNLCHTTAR